MKTNKKNLWIVPVYGIFYLIMFFVLENSSVTHQIIYSPLDDMIPFCEYFIVPYFAWFLFMAGTVLYFMFVNESSKEYRQLVSTLGTGMTAFLIVSFAIPNCHHLRPQLAEQGNVFLEAVRFLYSIDTSTNLIPSIHVYNTLACFAAVAHNERCRRSRGAMLGSLITTILIILSTMFLKQHSIIDVTIAFAFFGICYWIFYRFIPDNRKQFERILAPDQVFTIPNMLSLLRLFLGILFWGIGIRTEFVGKHVVLIVTLILSGITDFLDGWIARKFGMVSEFGKILDPIADKVTQGILLLYLVNKYPLMHLTLFLFLIKEVSMLLASSRLVLATGKNDGAKWYGKVSTMVFYIVMIILVIFPEIPLATANGLIGICSFCLGGAFVLYMNYYMTEYYAARGKTRWPA